MRRNAYAAKMMAAKGAVTQRQKSVLVNRCITTIYQASAIALNDCCAIMGLNQKDLENQGILA